MSGFIATLRTQIGRTTRAHGRQLALETNAELSLLKPRDNKRCGWKKALFLTRAVTETLMSVSFILCANGTPLRQSLTFFRSRRLGICELSMWQPCGARLKNYPSFRLVMGFYTLQTTPPHHLCHCSPRKEHLKPTSLCFPSQTCLFTTLILNVWTEVKGSHSSTCQKLLERLSPSSLIPSVVIHND